MLTDTSITQFTQLVNSALKNYHSVLTLARSPLADSALVQPLLVLDDVSPTADERGQALRLVLQWAVTRLAPGSIAYPLGVERPYDDPTWRDPHWWRYTILRHRYLEPLHPDEFVDGGRFTETLLALTGITSTDAFFDERNRAIREVAQWLREQLQSGQANAELQTLALEAVLRPLQRHEDQEALLGIAATFDDVFPRRLLLRMARAERIGAADRLLNELTAGRYLLMGDGGVNLWLSPVLQRHVYRRQPAARARSRHLAAAAYYRQEEEALKAAEHLQHAADWHAAATILLDAVDELVNDLQTDELLAALGQFQAEYLEPALWCAVQIVRSDLYRRLGQQEAALTACRQALPVTVDATQLGQLYWRMGKLYEKRNQLQALAYYERAMSNFAVTASAPPVSAPLDSTLPDPATVDLIVAEVRKDRGWLYLLRHEWAAAHTDLHAALALLRSLGGALSSPAHHTELHANVLDALAHLHFEQTQFDEAIAYAQQALHLREEAGDLLQVAKSFNNLGNFYNQMGNVDDAVAAHDEAIQLYQKLNNLALAAEAWLNRGVVYHTAGRQQAAIANYHKSLALSQRLGLLWAEVTAHANLTEAHAELGEQRAAQRHWHYGYELSQQAAFSEELAYFRELADRFDLFPLGSAGLTVTANDSRQASVDNAQAPMLTPRAMLTPDEQAVLALAEARGQVTPRLVMATYHVSKATATRRLSALSAVGLLRQQGKGRGTCYVPVTGVEQARTNHLPTIESALVASDAYPRRQARADSQADEAISRVRTSLPLLIQEHNLQELTLLPPVAGEPQLLRLAVRFTATPSLAAFFELERTLRAQLQQPIDLIPAEQIANYSSGQPANPRPIH